MCRIVQMSKYTVLSLKNTLILVESFSVIRIYVYRIWARKISDLCNTELAIADLMVKKAWSDFVRIDIWLTSDDIVPNA